MSTYFKPLNLLIIVLSLFGLLMLIDFCFYKEKNVGRVDDVIISYERYLNAGGNGHKIYALAVARDTFKIDEAFLEKIGIEDQISYTKSLFFNEINWFRPVDTSGFNFYSLRIFNGLVIPIVFFILLGLTLKNPKRYSILQFVVSIVLILDFSFLLLY